MAMASASQPSPDSSHTLDVSVTHYESVDKIYVVRTADESKLQLIWEFIEDVMKKTNAATTVLRPSELQPLMPCVAFYKDRWYRARVISIIEDGEILVEYIDYGNLERITIDQIRQIPEDPTIRSTPRLSQSCRLSGDLDRMDMEKLRRIIDYHGNFRMKIDDEDEETGQFEVTMYYAEGDGKLRCVNEIVLTDKHSGHQNGDARPQNAEATATTSTSYSPYDADPHQNGSIHHQQNGYGPRSPTERPQSGYAYGNAAHGAMADNFGRLQIRNGEPKFGNSGTGHRHENESGSQGTSSVQPKPPFGGYPVFKSDYDDILHGRHHEDSYDDDDDSDDDDEEPSGSRRGFNPASATHSRGRMEDERTAYLRQQWGPILSMRFPDKEPPPSQSSVSEQAGFVTHVNSPTSFYVQTNSQRQKNKNLQLAMNDDLDPNAPPIPECLVEEGVCCVVLNEKTKVWYRGRVISVDRREQPAIAVVQLIDIGYEKPFPLSALRPIPELYIKGYPAAVYHARLGGHLVFENPRLAWQPRHIDHFRTMVMDKTIYLKFLSGTSLCEVEIRDMNHRCAKCSRWAKQKLCSINEIMLEMLEHSL